MRAARALVWCHASHAQSVALCGVVPWCQALCVYVADRHATQEVVEGAFRSLVDRITQVGWGGTHAHADAHAHAHAHAHTEDARADCTVTEGCDVLRVRVCVHPHASPAVSVCVYATQLPNVFLSPMAAEPGLVEFVDMEAEACADVPLVDYMLARCGARSCGMARIRSERKKDLSPSPGVR